MTRLEVLCKLNKQQGGTIHQFNQQYGVDLLAFSNFQFKMFLALKFGQNETFLLEAYFPTSGISEVLAK